MDGEYWGELEGLGKRARTERGKHVAALARWMVDDPENALPRPISRIPDAIVGATSMKKYFAKKRTFGDQWGGVCHAVLEHLRESSPRTDPPETVVLHSNRYRKARSRYTDQIPRTAQHSYSQTQFSLWTESELLDAVAGDDLSQAVAAARFVVNKHDSAMRTPGQSAFETIGEVDRRTGNQKALESAQSIIEIARLILDRLSERGSTRPSDHVLEDCVHIFESTADARRLRSRDPARESNELYELVELRRADLKVTRRVRAPVDRVFAEYHRDAVDALLRDPTAEVAAVGKMLGELNHLVHGKNGTKHRQEIKTDAFLAAVARLASYGVVYPDLRETLRESAALADKIYPPSLEHQEIRTLLNQAGLLWERTEIPSPTQLLQMARYRGVGELLLARALVRIGLADAETPGLSKFLGEDRSVTSPVRPKALQRAVIYYERSFAWLRTAGAAGRVRETAFVECKALKSRLRHEDSSEHPQGPDATRPDVRLRKLQDQIDEIIADSIIRTDFTGPHGHGAYRVGVALKMTLMQVLRVLDDPFTASLRTDMSPIEFPG
ncbi:MULTISPECIES: hypothetical protein [Nocardiaceae]|uniref:hypothetical protein n=1 Tax=Nocardiaceae TaxID=85025 RepID=UPI000B0FAFF8|nr:MULTISPECIES: hypothetical protein [Rhodococcus]OZD38741.1 hypothetical protein CH284_06310 [Rhodococcus sp. 06-156-3]OZF57201.1 hypothetical protein CH290_27095 [Rhodococcus sp. 06-156-4]